MGVVFFYHNIGKHGLSEHTFNELTLTMKWFSFPGILFLVNLTWYNELRLYRSKWSAPGTSLEVFYCYTKKGKRGWISMFQVFVSFKIAIDVSLKDSNNSFKEGIFQILFQLHSLHHFFFLIFMMKKIYILLDIS